MAYQTGTANDYRDLLDRFISFVTSNSDLTDAGQAWQVLAQSDFGDDYNKDVYFQAPGEAGDQEIHTRIRAYGHPANDVYNWRFQGAVDYLASADFGAQPNTSPSTYAYFWDDTIPYWFVANGRRAVVVAKVSTVYECAYLGYWLP